MSLEIYEHRSTDKYRAGSNQQAIIPTLSYGIYGFREFADKNEMRDSMREEKQRVRANTSDSQVTQQISTARDHSTLVTENRSHAEPWRANIETFAARAAYVNEPHLTKPMKYSNPSEGARLRQALSRNNTQTTTGSSSQRTWVSSSKATQGARLGAPSEGLVTPALYCAVKQSCKQIVRSATTDSSSTRSKPPTDYIAEFKGINQSASPSEGEFLTALAYKVHDKQRRHAEKKAVRKAREIEEQVEAARAAADMRLQKHQRKASDGPPIWREEARAAKYQQAIISPETLDRPHSMKSKSVSHKRFDSAQCSEPGGPSRQTHHGSDDSLYAEPPRNMEPAGAERSRSISQKRSYSHQIRRSKSNATFDLGTGFADATVAFGHKFKKKFSEYSEKRDAKREETRARKAEERREQLRHMISRPVEAKGNSPVAGWDLPGSLAHLNIAEEPAQSFPVREPSTHQLRSATTSPVTIQHSQAEQLKMRYATRSRQETHHTLFSEFINAPSSPEGQGPVPSIPKEANEKPKGKSAKTTKAPKTNLTAAVGHKFDDVAGTLRSYKPHLPHLPYFHKSGSDESFHCVGAGRHSDGTPAMPSFPQEVHEQAQGPANVANLNPDKQMAALLGLNEYDGDSKSYSREPTRVVGAEGITIADSTAVAGMLSKAEFELGHADTTVHRIHQHDTNDRVGAMAPKIPSNKEYDSMYSYYSGQRAPSKGKASSPTQRESWESDEEPYVPPRQAWKAECNKKDMKIGAQRVPQNSYYQMVERDRSSHD